MKFGSLENILKFAIEKEIEAAEFYEMASREETYSGAGKLLVDFAAEERKHQRLLENFSSDKKVLASYKLKWIPDMKRSDYIVDIDYKKGMSYPDLLRLAMKREEKALKLYNELAREADHADAFKLFQVLSQEEAKHKKSLETIYDDFMAKQGD